MSQAANKLTRIRAIAFGIGDFVVDVVIFKRFAVHSMWAALLSAGGSKPASDGHIKSSHFGRGVFS